MGCSSLGPSSLNTCFSQLFVLRLFSQAGTSVSCSKHVSPAYTILQLFCTLQGLCLEHECGEQTCPCV